MSKAIFIIIIICSFHSRFIFAAKTCSRIARINYQEILIDTNSTQKGEGLRYHLAKDPKALMYLDLYQEGSKTKLTSTILGTLSTLLITAGLFTNKSSSGRDSLFIGGASFMALNFLVANTLDHKNESNLTRAIDEYNKRNLPHIEFNPNSNTKKTGGKSFLINFRKEF